MIGEGQITKRRSKHLLINLAGKAKIEKTIKTNWKQVY